MTTITVEEATEWLAANKPNHPWSVHGGDKGPVIIGLPCQDKILLYFAVDGSSIGGIADTIIRMTGAPCG